MLNCTVCSPVVSCYILSCFLLLQLFRRQLILIDIIPLSPALSSSHDSHFIVHWLNNKELQFTVESEKLMNDINSKTHDHHEEAIDEFDNAESVIHSKSRQINQS